MPSVIVSLLALLAALAPLALEYYRRRVSPTPQQRADARQSEIDALYSAIEYCEIVGDLAGADAIRRRLRTLLLDEHQRDPDPPGQRLPPATPAGDDNHPP